MIGESPDVEAVADTLGLTYTQAGILAAYVELIEELGTDDVPFRLIARRAGVGQRTVFRHYAARTELLDAAARWLEHAVFVRPGLESVFDAPLAIREAMERYGRRPELAHVAAEFSMRGGDPSAVAPSRATYERMLRQEIGGIDADELRDAAAVLCHLESAGTWVSLSREFGMSTADIADTAAWAAEGVLDPLRVRAAGR